MSKAPLPRWEFWAYVVVGILWGIALLIVGFLVWFA